MTGTILSSLGLLFDFIGVVMIAWGFLVEPAPAPATQAAAPAHAGASGRVMAATALILLGFGLQFAGRWAPELLTLTHVAH